MNPLNRSLSLNRSLTKVVFGTARTLLLVAAFFQPCLADGPAIRPPSAPTGTPPVTKAWLAHPGNNPFVPLAKDEATFARMASAYQTKNTQAVAALSDAQGIISVPLGTIVDVVRYGDQSALVAIESGIYSGTKWYVSPFFLRTEAQARAIANQPRTAPRHSRPDFSEVDANMNLMNSQLQERLRVDRATVEALTAPKPTPPAIRFGVPYLPPSPGTPVMLEHYCFYQQGTKSACRNLIRDVTQPYCFLHRLTIE